jgi:gluconolactonase
MPNGLVLTPDGKRLLVNNTYDSETFWNVDTDKDNFIWAYDVNPDGTLAGPRKFCELFLTPEVLDRGGRTTSADGMTIDSLGNPTSPRTSGFDLGPKGEFIGIVNSPLFRSAAASGR